VIDLLARSTSWTLLHESMRGVQFAGVLFYDGQAFMVRARGAASAVDNERLTFS
jgi:general L-amino acid transport system substrate-binding protein